MEKVFFPDLDGNIQSRNRITRQEWDSTQEYALREEVSKETKPIEVFRDLEFFFRGLLNLARLSLPRDIIVELVLSDIIHPIKYRDFYKSIEWRYNPSIKQSTYKPKKPIRRKGEYLLSRVVV